jgi:SAM-dependent methyltransferase
MMSDDRLADGLAWQTGVWNRMSDVYLQAIDVRFEPVVEQVLARAELAPGQRVIDLGSGTGTVALMAAPRVAPAGHVLGVDISPDMLTIARRRATSLGLGNLTFQEGRAESLPASDGSQDVVLASLSLMYVIDREAASREIARVLRPGGRFVAAVWAGPERCDIVRFQQTAGSFAPPPPVVGVGPGALADASPLLARLADVGIDARIQTETLGFDFPDFASAWHALAAVTTAQLPGDRQAAAMAAVRTLMWPNGDGPRHFTNLTQFIVGTGRRP